MRALALAVALALAGCATDKETAPSPATAVWTPCPTQVPPKPTFPADSLTWKEDIFTIGTTLLADWKARRAYELDLETRLKGCTSAERPPA